MFRGVLLTANPDSLTLVATDGWRLAVASAEPIPANGPTAPAEALRSFRVAHKQEQGLPLAVRFHADPGAGGVVSLFAQMDRRSGPGSPDRQTLAAHVPCRHEGRELDIGFNVDFLLDALRVLGRPEVTMEMTAPDHQILVRDEPRFLYVLMPVRITPA